MNIKIRKNVFETNSSSMHSVCVEGGTARYANFPTGVIDVSFDDYGWGYDELTSISEKLSYVLSCFQYYDGEVADVKSLKQSQYYAWLSEMIQDYTGAVIEINAYDESDIGSVDHQSIDTLDNYWHKEKNVFMENMKELLFNANISIVIDNDNH